LHKRSNRKRPVIEILAYLLLFVQTSLTFSRTIYSRLASLLAVQ